MLFETIFDTIEERHLTELGVEAMGEGGEGSEYQAVRELFRERFPAQLRELLKKTRRADGGSFESEEEANDVSGFGWAGWSVGMHGWSVGMHGSRLACMVIFVPPPPPPPPPTLPSRLASSMSTHSL